MSADRTTTRVSDSGKFTNNKSVKTIQVSGKKVKMTDVNHQPIPGAPQLMQIGVAPGGQSMYTNMPGPHAHAFVDNDALTVLTDTIAKLNEDYANQGKKLDNLTDLLNKANERAERAEARAEELTNRLMQHLEGRPTAAPPVTQTKKAEPKRKKQNSVQAESQAPISTANRFSLLPIEGDEENTNNAEIHQDETSSEETTPKRNCNEDRTVGEQSRRLAQPSTTVKRRKTPKVSIAAETLSEVDMDTDEHERSTDESSEATDSDSSSEDEDDQQQTTTTNSGERKKNSPSIIVDDMDTPRFMAYMTRKKITVQTKIIATGKQVIKCNYEDRETVMHWISKHGKGGKTSTPNDDRPGCSVVKGIYITYNEDDVKAEMEKFVDFPIRAVRRFQRDHTTAKNILHWWVVSTESKEQAMQLKKITHFNGARVTWEPYRGSSILRCFKCQRFHHLARNCLYSSRCGRCSLKHETKDCNIVFAAKGTKDYKEHTKCVNCVDRDQSTGRGHAAGDLTCPIYLEEAAKKEKKKEKDAEIDHPRRGGRPTAAAPTSADFDVNAKKRRGAPAPVAAPIPATWRPSSSYGVSGQTRDLISEQTQELFGFSPVKMLEIMGSYSDEVKRANTIAEKRLATIQMYQSLFNVSLPFQ